MRLLLLVLVLAGCTTADPFAKLVGRVPTAAMPAKLDPTMLERAQTFATMTLATRRERGVAREFGPLLESCRWNGPNPVIVGPRTEPRVGTPLVVSWQLSCVSPPPLVIDANGETSPPIVVMLMSFSPMETPVGSEAAPGCYLLVNPEHLLAPQPTGWLRYDSGRQLVTLDFTPASGLEGVSIFTQLLVIRPDANKAGMIVSKGLELHIGQAW